MNDIRKGFTPPAPGCRSEKSFKKHFKLKNVIKLGLKAFQTFFSNRLTLIYLPFHVQLTRTAFTPHTHTNTTFSSE